MVPRFPSVGFQKAFISRQDGILFSLIGYADAGCRLIHALEL
jgi:hypothetical protein